MLVIMNTLTNMTQHVNVIDQEYSIKVIFVALKCVAYYHRSKTY